MRICLCKVLVSSVILLSAPPDRIVSPLTFPTIPAPILDLTEIAVAAFVAEAREIGGASSEQGRLGSAFAHLVTCRIACERSGEHFGDAVAAALRPGGRLESRVGPLSATQRDELRSRLDALLAALDALSRTA
jgi:hypothetical protein